MGRSTAPQGGRRESQRRPWPLGSPLVGLAVGTHVSRASTAGQKQRCPRWPLRLVHDHNVVQPAVSPGSLKVEFIMNLSTHTSRRTPDNRSEIKLNNGKPRPRVQNSLDESAGRHPQGRVCCDAFGTQLFRSFFLKARPPAVCTAGPPDPDPPHGGGLLRSGARVAINRSIAGNYVLSLGVEEIRWTWELVGPGQGCSLRRPVSWAPRRGDERGRWSGTRTRAPATLRQA